MNEGDNIEAGRTVIAERPVKLSNPREEALKEAKRMMKSTTEARGLYISVKAEELTKILYQFITSDFRQYAGV